ncbi:hypothetical protein TELCIR_12046 [Teladorsagia circumcincta]|uniref:Uncharacterized protein n=1 Tax=Teladorsagia circumcincta TaxID=45464 RepID=A0A2G9U7L4_TELCI|nr:hypothetical protein TELCIR_12046 [Teladorsagia circumcincta]
MSEYTAYQATVPAEGDLMSQKIQLCPPEAHISLRPTRRENTMNEQLGVDYYEPYELLRTLFRITELFTLMDPAFVCFSDDQLRLSGSQLEHFLNTVVFPPLCAFGIVGNILTIMVLVNNDLMSRGGQHGNMRYGILPFLLCEDKNVIKEMVIEGKEDQLILRLERALHPTEPS